MKKKKNEKDSDICQYRFSSIQQLLNSFFFFLEIAEQCSSSCCCSNSSYCRMNAQID